MKKLRFGVGQIVKSDKYGRGIVTAAYFGAGGSENYAVKFDKGGPQGWATRATNDVESLTVVNR